MFKSKNSRNEILHSEIGQSYDSDGLNLKEKMVIDFITKNPGVTKQKVVDALDGKFSRVIVFNTIKELENFDIIMIKKNKPNSQIHRLYINKHNQILVELDKLSNFEVLIIFLFEKIKNEEIKAHALLTNDNIKMNRNLGIDETIESIHNSIRLDKISPVDVDNRIRRLLTNIDTYRKPLDSFNRQKMCLHMLYELFHILWKVSQAYTIRAVFIWPSQENNNVFTNKLIQTVLAKLTRIQLKISRIVSYISYAEDKYEESKGLSPPRGISMYQRMFNTLIKESGIVEYEFSKKIKLFQDYGWEKEAKDLAIIANKITENLYLTFQGSIPTIEWAISPENDALDTKKSKKH